MLGNNIKAQRIKSGYSQQEVADKLNITRQTVSSWEVNRTEPTMGNIEMMAKLFHCRKSELIGESDTPMENGMTFFYGSAAKRRLMNLVIAISEDQAEATLQFLENTGMYDALQQNIIKEKVNGGERVRAKE